MIMHQSTIQLIFFLSCLALPHILIYLVPLLIYRLPIDNRIGEQIFELSGPDIAAATGSVLLALLLWISIPLLIRKHFCSSITPVYTPRRHIWLMFLVLCGISIPASLANSILVMPAFIENLVRIASLMSIAAVGVGTLLLQKGNISRKQLVLVRTGIAFQVICFVILPAALGYLTNIVTILPVALFLLIRTQSSIVGALRTGSLALIPILMLIALLQAGKNTWRLWAFGGEYQRPSLVSPPPSSTSTSDCSNSRVLWASVPRSEIFATEALGNLRSKLQKHLVRLENVTSIEMGALVANPDLERLILEKPRDLGQIALLSALSGGLLISPSTLDVIASQVHTPIVTDPSNLPTGLQLGLAYEIGDGSLIGTASVIRRDLSIAARIFIMELSQHTRAAIQLGLLLEKGWGMPKNLPMSLACFRLAAERGDTLGFTEYIKRVASLPWFHEEHGRALEMAARREDEFAAKSISFFDGTTLRRSNLPLMEIWYNNQLQNLQSNHDVNRDRLHIPLLLIDKWTGGMVAGVAMRLNQIGNLATAMREVPTKIDGLGWRVYLPLLTWPIPRILWENKPREISGLLIGQQLGLQKPDDPLVAWSMPLLVEAWLAGGIAHFIFAIVLVLLVNIWLIWLGSLHGEIGYLTVSLVGLATMANGMSSGLAATCGGTLQATIAVFLLHHFIRKFSAIQQSNG